MVNVIEKKVKHPSDIELADYAAGLSADKNLERMERHLSSCDECLDKVVAAHETVTKKGVFVKKFNIYFVLTAVSFLLSFAAPRFFLQLLAATLLFGIKWIVDSKTTRMLVMIYDAWKRDGEPGVSDALKSFERQKFNRIFSDKPEKDNLERR